MAQASTNAPPGMVLVPAGEFLFDKVKRQTVKLNAFWIDKDPVTNREYEKFVAATGRPRPTYWPDGPLPEALLDHPVVKVTYEDAQAYATWAQKDLPTPLQWEKAARGVDGRKYPWGSAFDAHRTNTKESALGKTVPVHALTDESPYGVRGTSGNVLQWTRGFADAEKTQRVLKGGSYRQYLGALTWSHGAAPFETRDDVGFRCTRLVPA